MLVQWACFICKKIVDSKLGLLMHFDEEHSNATYYKQTASADGGVYQVYSKDLGVGVGDVFHSFEIMCSKDMFREFEEIVQRFLVQQSAGKVSLIVTALFRRMNDPESLPSPFPLRTKAQLVTVGVDIPDLYHNLLHMVNLRIGQIQMSQTGWVITRLVSSQIEFIKINPLSLYGHSFPLNLTQVLLRVRVSPKKKENKHPLFFFRSQTTSV